MRLGHVCSASKESKVRATLRSMLSAVREVRWEPQSLHFGVALQPEAVPDLAHQVYMGHADLRRWLAHSVGGPILRHALLHNDYMLLGLQGLSLADTSSANRSGCTPKSS